MKQIMNSATKDTVDAIAVPRGKSPARYAIAARIERLPACRALRQIVLLIAVGGWFEFYELFLPSGISTGLVHDGIFTLGAKGLLDFGSFPSFLASFFLGMFFSTLLFSRLSDVLGRRFIFVWALAGYSLCNVLIAVSSSPGWIDLFRFGAGLGVGTQLMNTDSFLAELLPRHIRGRYMAFAMTFILSGTPASVLLGTLFTPNAPLGISGWRWVVLAGALGGVLVWFIQRHVPESPRWLEARGRLDAADAAMRKIEATIEADYGPLPPPNTAVAEPKVRAGHWSEMFTRRYLPRTLAFSIFQFCQTIPVFGFSTWVPVILVSRGYNVVHSLAYARLYEPFLTGSRPAFSATHTTTALYRPPEQAVHSKRCRFKTEHCWPALELANPGDALPLLQSYLGLAARHRAPDQCGCALARAGQVAPR